MHYDTDAMRNFVKIQLRPLTIIFALSAIVNLFLWLFTYRQYQIATDLIPLHYTIYFGIDLIDFKTKLFTYPTIGIIILIVNSSLGVFIRKEPLIVYILAITTLFAEIFTALAFSALVLNYY